jgi:AraC-like DNA-binding protein
MRCRSLTASFTPAGCSRPASTIAETAGATVFPDQSHVHRHFKRSLGLTPGQYQRRLVT